MGNCSSAMEVTNENVADGSNFDEFRDVHAICIHVDYGFEPAKSAGWCPAGFGDKLDTPENAEMFKKLCADCGITDVTVLANQGATKETVLAAVQATMDKCDEDDLFLFFYSGHGMYMADQDGDEADGKDEAMCLPDANGNCNEGTWLRDDDFSAAVAEGTTGYKLFILDCCHSGTLLDFSKPHWNGQKAVSICGCKDTQESAAMGGGTRGGAFSKSINDAVRAVGEQSVSVGRIFNDTLKVSPKYIPASHSQDITISCPAGMSPDKMEWPLVCLR